MTCFIVIAIKTKASLCTSLPPPDRLASLDPSIHQQADALRDACCDDSRFGWNLWNHDGSLHLLWGEGNGEGRRGGPEAVRFRFRLKFTLTVT